MQGANGPVLEKYRNPIVCSSSQPNQILQDKNEHDRYCDWKKPIEQTINVNELQQLYRRQQEWLKVLQAQLTSKDQQIHSLSQAFVERTQQIASLQKELIDRAQQMIVLQQELAKRDALLASLYSTANPELKENEPRRKTSSSVSSSSSQRSPKTPRAINSPPDGRSSPYESIWTSDSLEELSGSTPTQWINVSFPPQPKSAKK